MLALGIISAVCILLYLFTKNVFPADGNSQIQVGGGTSIINSNGMIKIKGKLKSLEVNGRYVVI